MGKVVRAGKTSFFVVCLCVMLGLTACGGKEADEDNSDEMASVSSITVNKDGSITSRIVEEFGESYYDEGNLKAMIESSIAAYQSEIPTAQVKLKSCDVSDGMAQVLMEFGDYSAYAGFNEENFFAGTVLAANQAGFDLNVTLSAVSDKAEKTSVTKPDLLEMGDSHIVIVEAVELGEGEEAETMRINCYDEILYVGEGVTAVGKKSADVTLSEGFGIIVFK